MNIQLHAKYNQSDRVITDHQGIRVEGEVVQTRHYRVNNARTFEYLVAVYTKNLRFWKEEGKIKPRYQ